MMKKITVMMLSVCLIASGCAPIKKDARPNSDSNQLHIQNKKQAGNSEEYANYVQLMSSKVWPYMSVIWPNVNFSRFHMLLTDGKCVWDVYPKGLRELPLEEVLRSFEMPSNIEGIPGGYSAGKWQRQASVLVYMNQEEIMNHLKTYMTSDQFGMSYGTPFAFPLGTHVLFHDIVQSSKWNENLPAQSKDRSLSYPIDIGPRTYRLAMIDKLYEAYLDKENREKHLTHAAYMYQMWKWEFPEDEERVRRLDVVEGTAHYVDTMADAYGKLGMKANTAKLRTYLVRRLKETTREDVTTIRQESAELVKLAGLIADESDLRWKKKAEQGVTPVELLFEGINPLKIEKWADVMDNYRNIAQKNSRKTDQAISSFLSDYDNKEIPLLVIASRNRNEGLNIRIDGQFHLDAVAIDLLTNVVGKFGGVHIQANQKTIGIRYKAGSKAEYIIPIKETDIRIQNNHAVVNTTELKGEFDVQVDEDSGGRKIYLAQVIHR
ncbi:hypothetical protein NV379_16115 [Paenibacillus sp. N1-5-1-14]|uniref:hypothetical protein n=1 Tax=Paenibacillus radicibacter TaxID=2972488 RepID=UPI0021593697|nr:hypothetical protein [Paenibacillus radicibacter]MCR8644180.1 hypothetical protein [Paenibacillus radicibacter]